MSKRDTMQGRPVSKEEVIEKLGVPSEEWERNSRRLQFRNRLRPGQDDLDIAGIRGYGGSKGYLDYLAQSVCRPLGVGSGLVTPEEDKRIVGVLIPEIVAEFEKYQARLSELEKSPAEVRGFLSVMRRHLAFCRQAPAHVPDPDLPEEFQAMEAQAAKEREADLKTLETEIEQYAKLLAMLERGHEW